MESSSEKILSVHPDLEEEWSKIKQVEGKSILDDISKEIFGSSTMEGKFMQQYKWKNGFAEAARIAYQHHLPLSLSPDQVWLAIAQGFANHVNENAEALRAKFVQHEGKKKLIVTSGETDLFRIDWATAISQFSGQIKEHIGEKTHSTLTPQFTTTKDIERVACEVTLMDAMQAYFEYEMVCGCGISKVRLLGTLEDWVKIKEMAERLREYDAEWWLNALIPVLDKFIKAYQGEVDQTFWNDIYVFREGRPSFYSAKATGWIVNFFPYLSGRGSKLYQNKYLFVVGNKGLVEQEGPSPDSIPSGLSKAPVKVTNLITGEVTLVTFASGFFGVRIEEGFVSPHVAWAISREIESDKRHRW